MPQTTPERAARWPGYDAETIGFLKSQGWSLGFDWCWTHPENREPTERERDAVFYLIEEWDFGGIIRKEPRHD